MQKYDASNIAEVNGVRLHYAAAGEGRPVLLVHGNAEDHDLFSRVQVVNDLLEHFNVRFKKCPA